MAADSAAPPTGLSRTDFLAAIRRNRRNTALLCILLTLIGVVVGAGIGWAYGILIDETGTGEGAGDYALYAGGFMLLFSLVWTAVALFLGDKLVLGLTGARAVAKEDAPVLWNVVEEMALAAGLPMPQVAIMETDALNAFATGLKPEKATVAVTRGLLDALSRDELQGVVAHEMSHIANDDVLYMTAVGVLVGLIVLVSDLALRSTRFVGWGGGGHGRRSSGDRKGGGGLVVIAILVLLLIGLLSPVAARLVQMAVSRQREYLADATSVKLTRNPLGLIGALRKLDQATARFDNASKAVQHLFIVNPFRKFGEHASALMATHPSIEQRIERLRALG
ncbi:MAG: M48 family metallopeptidase [Alphaproteobacteria bacterium]|nr:M48 family metallopeptidase [Alphaproteobacteria bacterium]